MNRLHRNKNIRKNIPGYLLMSFIYYLQISFLVNILQKIYKTGRKENAIPTIITQNIADVIKNEDGCKILSNSEFVMILKQKPLDLPPICKIF